MLEEILRIENGSIKKNGQDLIKRLNLQAYRGEILGLISDNLWEKQCILDIFNGSLNLDYGWIAIDEKRLQDDEAAHVLKNKIAVIESKSKLVNNLSVAENIFVVRGGFKKYFIHKKLLYKQAGGLLSDFGRDIRPYEYAGRLTPLERCMVELIKAYATGHRLIVCSDFTSFLSSSEVDKVIQTVLWLKRKGVSFIFIENFDDVLFRYSDRLAIIHDGRTVWIFDGEDIDKDTVYALLMGVKQIDSEGNRENDHSLIAAEPPLVFEMDQVSSPLISKLSLRLHQGEIINILCQEEESIKELLGLFKGEVESVCGEIKLESKKYSPAGMWDAIKRGVCFIEEDPIANMLFYDMSAIDNLSFAMSNKVRGFWFYRKYRRSIKKQMEDIFGEDVLNKPITQLEPVILQKLAYHKWLLYLPKVVVCKKPFSAVDVHMRQVTKDLLSTFSQKGIAVIILTSNISEASMMGGRILHLKGLSSKE